MTRHRALPALIVLVLSGAVAGCSGGGKTIGTAATTVPAPTTTAAPATTVSPTSTTDPVRVAKANAAILQAGDFPAGWKALTAADGGGLNVESIWKSITTCLGLTPPAPAAAATSPTYIRGLATQTESTVEYTSDAFAKAAAAALAGPMFQACANMAFAADVKQSAPQGSVPGPVTIAPLAYPSVAAATTSTFRINVTIDMGGLMVPLFQDFVVAYGHGAIIRLLFLNPGSEFPQDLEHMLVDAVVGRA